MTNKPLGWTMGSGVDIHKQILKVAQRRGLTIPGHNYTGPGNPLHDQLRHDDKGNILEIYRQPRGQKMQLVCNMTWITQFAETIPKVNN